MLVLQALSSLHLLFVLAFLFSAFRAGPPLSFFFFAYRIILPVALAAALLALVLSLQRLLPRSHVVAPVTAAIWWLLTATMSLLTLPSATPTDGAGPRYLGTALGLTFALWLAVSTLIHKRTRAYLVDPASTGRARTRPTPTTVGPRGRK